MTRTVTLLILLLLYCVAACDWSASAGPPSPSRAAEPSAVVPSDHTSAPSASEIPPSAATTPPAEKPPAAERRAPVRVPPRTLAISWPQYIGQRVSVACRPVRRLDFTRTLVVADGAPFVVMSSPEVTPCGAATSTFTVLGSTTLPIAGRMALPELLIEDEGEQLR